MPKNSYKSFYEQIGIPEVVWEKMVHYIVVTLREDGIVHLPYLCKMELHDLGNRSYRVPSNKRKGRMKTIKVEDAISIRTTALTTFKEILRGKKPSPHLRRKLRGVARGEFDETSVEVTDLKESSFYEKQKEIALFIDKNYEKANKVRSEKKIERAIKNTGRKFKNPPRRTTDLDSPYGFFE